MRVVALTLKRFRNYREAEFAFDARANVLYGENGKGKTNILEALYLLAGGRSFRTHRDEDMCLKPVEESGDAYYYIRAVFVCERTNEEMVVEMSYLNGKKRVAIDKKEARRRRDLIGKFLLILFLPNDTALIDGDPKTRREFFNVFLSNAEPSYLSDVIRYHAALKARNRCLKMHSADYSLYDEPLAKTGLSILQWNRDYVKRVEEEMNVIAKEALGERPLYTIAFRDGAQNVSDSAAYLRALRQSAAVNERLKTTTFGPHRAEYLLCINGAEARRFASQGEKRMAVAIMKLAEDRIIAQRRNEAPILLIDDALLELDTTKRAKLLAYLNGKGQIFATVTEPATVSDYVEGKTYRVADYAT